MVLFSVGVVVLYLSKLPYGKSDSQVGLLMVIAPAFHVEYWFSGVWSNLVMFHVKHCFLLYDASKRIVWKLFIHWESSFTTTGGGLERMKLIQPRHAWLVSWNNKRQVRWHILFDLLPVGVDRFSQRLNKPQYPSGLVFLAPRGESYVETLNKFSCFMWNTVGGLVCELVFHVKRGCVGVGEMRLWKVGLCFSSCWMSFSSRIV